MTTSRAKNSIKPSDLMGATEVATHLGVSRQRVLELRQKNPKFPEPVIRLSSGPVWDRKAIDDFVDQWDRTPGRPRKETPGGLVVEPDHEEQQEDLGGDGLVPEQPMQESALAEEAQ